MSYNSYYKSSRGRGFGSRGAYRGRGGDSGSGRGRGSSRGRFNWFKERSSGFESRSRYLSGGGGGGGGGVARYTGYRRFRGDDIDYPPRERYHRSPVVSRKRIRSEHSYLQISEDDDDLIEGELAIKKKIKKVKKEKTKEEEPEEGEEVDGDEGEDGGEENKEGEEKVNSEAKDAKDDSDAQSASEEGQRKKPAFDLSCPHCHTKCDTVQEYKMHLYSSKHISAMRKQALLHKQTLQRLRMSQRQRQRIVEEADEYRTTLTDRTKFCPLCKLNYRQPKSVHMTSDDHEEMVKFLNPYCRVCKQRFNTPMFYEHHLCSLDHIKFKSLLADKSKSDDEDGGKDDEKELNLDNFMILDSVGSVDETGEEGESGAEEKGEKREGEEKKPKTKAESNIGSEYTRKVEVYYCDLCRTYLPWYDDQEKALSAHCRSRSHLQRYVRYREDRLLRKEAERLHQKKLAKRKAEKEAKAKKASEKKDQSEKTVENKENKTEKDGEKSSEDTAGESPKKKGKKPENGDASQGELQVADGTGQEQDQDLETGTEEDLDKEIGDILDEVEAANKSSDEDEGSRGRYDRFQNSEKKGSAALDTPQPEDDGAKVVAEGGEQTAEVDEGIKKPVESKSDTDSPSKKASAPDAISSDTPAK